MPPLLVTAAIIEERGRYLITQRRPDCRHAGLWEFPGGKLEEGESPEQALQRELKEELDLTIAVDDVVTTIYHPYDWGAVLLLAYRCRIISGQLRHIEVADHRWTLPREMFDYPFLPADLPLIKQLATRE